MQSTIGVSVKEFMEIDIMKGAKILSGHKGLGRRMAKMNVMEVPDIADWVSPFEFLLTTAFSIKDDVTRLKDLIPVLHEKKVAGIGIKTKRYVSELPAEVLDESNKYGLPIIEIPFEVSYSDIIMPALTEIINKQMAVLSRIHDFHNSLIDTIIHGGSLSEIADVIEKSIENPVRITEEVFKTSVGSKVPANEGNYVRHDIPIKVDDMEYGHITIWEKNRELSPMELTVIMASASIISLDLLKKLSIFQVENKHKTEFFDDLFSDDDARVQGAYDSKIHPELSPGNMHAVVMISNDSRDSFLSEKIIGHLDNISVRGDEKMLYAKKGDKVIVLLSVSSSQEDENLRLLSLRVTKEVSDYFEGEKLRLGTGRGYREIHQIRESYKEARRVCEYLQLSDGAKALHYDDLGIYRILSHDGLRPELSQFYRDMLRSVVEYDKERGSDLLDTLKMYFEHRGNIKKVSEGMFTHYNTIVYRMNRIKEITKLDLENSNDYLNMQIAVKIYELFN